MLVASIIPVVVAACETALAAPPRQMIDHGADALKLGVETVVSDAFEVSGVYQTEEEIMEATGAKEKKKGRLGRLTWEFPSADTLNSNRRIYPRDVYHPAIEAVAARVAKNVVFGNIDHPSEFDYDSMIIKLSDAGVKIVETKMLDEQKVRVVCDIMDNKHGQQLASVLAVKGNPGVSQRAVAMFHEATDADRVRYDIPEDMYVLVADMLRIATFDVVGEAGFKEAHGAVVTENKQGSATMTLEELRKQFPDLYNSIHGAAFNEGKAAGLKDVEAQVTAAVEQRKPQIVAEAIKPLNEQITALETKHNTLVDAIKGIKPALETAGVVNEKITDKDAAGQIATLQAQKAATEAELAAAKGQLKAADDANLNFKRAQDLRTAMEGVSKAYEKHPLHDKILSMTIERMRAGNVGHDKALETAGAVVALIHELNPAVKAAAEVAMAGGTPPPITSGDPFAAAMDGLLKGNPQGNQSASGGAGGAAGVGGGAAGSGNEDAQGQAARKILLAGVPSAVL